MEIKPYSEIVEILKSKDKVLAKAQTQWVYFDINSKRPSRKVHDEVLKAFQINTL